MAGARVRRRLLLAGALTLGAAAAACGGPGAGPFAWSAAVPWSGIALGGEGQRRVGPLGAAVSGDRLAVLDSFAGRLLVWAWSGGWRGPVPVAVPGASVPLATLVLAPPGSGALGAVGDAAGTVWSLATGGAVRKVLSLPSSPGLARNVISLAWPPGGPLVADVVQVTDRQSARLLLTPGRDGSARILAQAELAAPAPGAAPAGWLIPTGGVRSALGTNGPGAVWLVGARGGRAELVRVELDGRFSFRGPLPPALPRPVDFLGVAAGGQAFVLAGAGGPSATVVAFHPGGPPDGTLPLPPGPGPALPHPAAVDGRGALLLLWAGAETLGLRYLPPGRLPRPKSP